MEPVRPGAGTSSDGEQFVLNHSASSAGVAPNLEESTSPSTISFCTTCSNRAYQFKETFEPNLEIVQAQSNTEWIILNYNSQDGLDDFMRERLPGLPPRVIYAKDCSHRKWHASIAKNVAHRLASGRILVNLDCDNFIRDIVDVISKHATTKAEVFHLWSGRWHDGTYGRIALPAKTFYQLGGYNERFYPMGYQDQDLLQRAKHLGIFVLRRKCPPGSALRNTKKVSIEHCVVKQKRWGDFERANRMHSRCNIRRHRFVANASRDWGVFNGTITRGGEALV